MAIILGILAVFGPLSMDMYLPALPNIAKDFYTNASFLQLTITFFVLGLALGQLLTRPISDVTGRRKPPFNWLNGLLYRVTFMRIWSFDLGIDYFAIIPPGVCWISRSSNLESDCPRLIFRKRINQVFFTARID